MDFDVCLVGNGEEGRWRFIVVVGVDVHLLLLDLDLDLVRTVSTHRRASCWKVLLMFYENCYCNI